MLLFAALGSATAAAQGPGSSDTSWGKHSLNWETSPYNWRNSPYRYKNWKRDISKKETGKPATPPRHTIVQEYNNDSGKEYEVPKLLKRTGQF
ncbi:MAG TPA: hypothetical protein ENI64_13070 [Gammaproteobacteria bacterium]|nr:hypothetical protein [Gammaproteobacteria bacterium]